MTATAAERPTIPDDEIREWARATGRKVSERGLVGKVLRTEYEQQAAQLGASVDAGDPPGSAYRPGETGGPEKPPERPTAARPERRPKPVQKPAQSVSGRVRAWFNGATTTTSGGKKVTTPKVKADRPRTPVTRLVERVWNQTAKMAEFVNVPVARTMQWQSPYMGIVVEDVIAGTPLDKILQPLARAEGAVTGIGAMIAMPLIVGAITAEKNDPETHGLVAVARQQMLHAALDECIDSQLEMFGSRDLAAKIVKSAEQQAQRSEEIDAIRGMIFSPLPVVVEVAEDATPAQMQAAQEMANANAAAEQQMREAVAAIRFMPPPAAFDERGQAAERVAAGMAASAEAAVQAQAAMIAAAGGGTQ